MVRSRPALRLSSVLALAACLCAQLAGAVHSATVRHIACAEHGGVVELRAEAAATSSTNSTSTLRAARAEAHHEHCELCATFSAVANHDAPCVATHAFPLSSLRPATTGPLAVRALFRLAPKGSPPIAALG